MNGKFENPACHGRFNQGQEASSNEHSAQAKVPRTPAWQLDSNSATSSSRTPAPDGSRTVNLYADGSQTSYGGVSLAFLPPPSPLRLRPVSMYIHLLTKINRPANSSLESRIANALLYELHRWLQKPSLGPFSKHCTRRSNKLSQNPWY